jgi:hypothetical protein
MVTQGVIEAQVVQVWYGILNELRHRMQDAILLQHAQPTLASVFQLLKRIEMNMVVKWVITLGFNKENPKNFQTPLGQQL